MKWIACMPSHVDKKFLIESEIFMDVSTSKEEIFYKIYVYENDMAGSNMKCNTVVRDTVEVRDGQRIQAVRGGRA
jgi:hypothetical protein